MKSLLMRFIYYKRIINWLIFIKKISFDREND